MPATDMNEGESVRCNCMAEMDAKLADHNTKLQFTFGFGRDGSTWLLPLLSTEKIEKRVRKGPALAIPTFCPFCGVRYAPLPSALGEQS